jgi:hypothetical protein
VVCPKGTVIIASVEPSESLTLTGGLTLTCSEGEVNGSTSNEGSSTETVKGTTSAVTFVLSSCTNCTAGVMTNGTLEVHTEKATANGNGTPTASGFTTHTVCFGFTCNYATGNNRDLGIVKGSSTTGGTATFKIGAELELDSGSSFLCGSGNATWEGSYVVTSPDWLDID